jgi:hypothetical protein
MCKFEIAYSTIDEIFTIYKDYYDPQKKVLSDQDLIILCFNNTKTTKDKYFLLD